MFRPKQRESLLLCAALLALVPATQGCIHEYHPEYHPETSYNFVQQVSYSTTNASPSPPAPSPAPPPAPRPSPPPSPPPGPESLAGKWTEHVEGTTCDRVVSIRDIDGTPFASMVHCDVTESRPFTLETVSFKGRFWTVRRGPHEVDVAGNDGLDYRLERVGADELRGTVVVRREQGRQKPVTYPVVWRRGGVEPAPVGPYAWLVGQWTQSLDDKSYCDDFLRVEADADGRPRIYGHSCFAEGHFENYSLSLVSDEEGVLSLRRSTASGYVVDYRLRRDGSALRGIIIGRPPKSRAKEWPSETGTQWNRSSN